MRALLLSLLVLGACRTEPLSSAEAASDAGAGADLTSAPPPAATGTGCAALTTLPACLADVTCEAVLLCGDQSFQGCVDLGAPMPPFGPFCIRTRCGVHADEASCDADAACHSTYLDKTTLDCAPDRPDCNLGFDHCATGPAQCVAFNAPACKNNPDAHCVGDYVDEYDSSSCVVDCVRASACAR